MFKLFYDVNPCGLDSKLMRSAVELLDNEYVINIEAPGLNKEDIKIALEDNVLTVEAKRNKNEEKKYLLDERYYGDLYRSFKLKDIKDEAIKATFENGILEIRVPKLTEAETKKLITIE